jgi:hypothetical protein
MAKDLSTSSHPSLTPPLTAEELLSWLCLLRSRRVGVTTFYRLLTEHGSARAALDALPEVARAAGVDGYAAFPAADAEAEIDAGRRAGARLIAYGAPGYPAALADISDPPPLLWVMGDIAHLARPMVALVGARNASSLGLRMARKLADDLSDAGVVVVSGLARGIDTEAHKAALKGGTVAVMAGGVDVIYPPENTVLAQEIAENGVRLSEEPMHHARRRRRIARQGQDDQQVSGPDYTVLASYGHVRDLPPRTARSIPNTASRCVGGRRRQPQARQGHRRRAEGRQRLILATDPDREGEAISWHLRRRCQAQGAQEGHAGQPRRLQRDHQGAVTEAMKAPRQVDMELVEAYLARRALDYLVGFNLSPVLWRKLPGAKSAGRVQSVCLRLIVEREMEIEAFRAQEYWSVTAVLATPRGQVFEARLTLAGKKLDRSTSKDRPQAEMAVQAVTSAISPSVGRGEARQPQPLAPFMTSTLQQEASRKFGMGARQTHEAAQRLYEAGHITYMRTDGIDMAPEAVMAARDAIKARFGAAYVPESPRMYKNKAKNAQEAHECIRPPTCRRDAEAEADRRRPAQALRPDLEAHASPARWRPRGWNARRSRSAAPTARSACAPPARSCCSTASSRSTRKAATMSRRRRQARLPQIAQGEAPRSAPSRPSSISPSRRRATPRRRWSSGWRNWASAGPRPMPRSSRRSRTAAMSARTRTA